MADIVIKSSLNGNFTIVPNEFARNPKVTPRAARVFIYLMSNVEGWTTSAARVSKILEMGESTVGAALRDLEDLGYLRRERRNIDGGRFRWEYELYAHPVTISEKASDGATSGNDENVQVGTIGRKTTDGLTTSGNPSTLRRLSSNKTNVEEDHKNTQGSDPFDDWWEVYPKKVGKGQARKAYTTAVKKVGTDTLMEKLELFKAHHEKLGTDKRYIPNASTWLNGERWDDELIDSTNDSAPSLDEVLSWDVSFDDQEKEEMPF